MSKLTALVGGIFLSGLLVTGGLLLRNDKDPKQPPAPETEEVVVEQVAAPVIEAPTSEPTEEPTPEPRRRCLRRAWWFAMAG